MERDALDALEKRVAELRVVAADKAVLARTLADKGPMRFARVVAMAIVAVCGLVAFVGGREVGRFVAASAPCAGLRPGEFASIHMGAGTFSVTLDTNGNVTRDIGMEGRFPGITQTRTDPATVREIANRLVEGCFLEKRPAYLHATDVPWVVLSLRVGDRTTEFSHLSVGPIPMCGGRDDLTDIERTIATVARVDEAL